MKRFISMFLVLTLVFAVFAIADAESVKLAYKGGSIKLRTGPGKEYGYTAYLKDGTSITVLQKGSAWSKVKAGGKTGYIKSLYISGIGSLYRHQSVPVRRSCNVNNIYAGVVNEVAEVVIRLHRLVKILLCSSYCRIQMLLVNIANCNQTTGLVAGKVVS